MAMPAEFFNYYACTLLKNKVPRGVSYSPGSVMHGNTQGCSADIYGCWQTTYAKVLAAYWDVRA